MAMVMHAIMAAMVVMPVIVRMAMIAVMVMRMTMVMVVIVAGSWRVSAAFRFERRIDHGHFGA